MQRMSTIRMKSPMQPVLWPKTRASIVNPPPGATPEFRISYRGPKKQEKSHDSRNADCRKSGLDRPSEGVREEVRGAARRRVGPYGRLPVVGRGRAETVRPLQGLDPERVRRRRWRRPEPVPCRRGAVEGLRGVWSSLRCQFPRLLPDHPRRDRGTEAAVAPENRVRREVDRVRPLGEEIGLRRRIALLPRGEAGRRLVSRQRRE